MAAAGNVIRFSSYAHGLRTLRLDRNLTQEELAERAGMSVRAIRNAETGRVTRPHRDSLARLASALELTPDVEHQLSAATRSGLGHRHLVVEEGGLEVSVFREDDLVQVLVTSAKESGQGSRKITVDFSTESADGLPGVTMTD